MLVLAIGFAFQASISVVSLYDMRAAMLQDRHGGSQTSPRIRLQHGRLLSSARGRGGDDRRRGAPRGGGRGARDALRRRELLLHLGSERPQRRSRRPAGPRRPDLPQFARRRAQPGRRLYGAPARRRGQERAEGRPDLLPDSQGRPDRTARQDRLFAPVRTLGLVDRHRRLCRRHRGRVSRPGDIGALADARAHPRGERDDLCDRTRPRAGAEAPVRPGDARREGRARLRSRRRRSARRGRRDGARAARAARHEPRGRRTQAGPVDGIADPQAADGPAAAGQGERRARRRSRRRHAGRPRQVQGGQRHARPRRRRHAVARSRATPRPDACARATPSRGSAATNS